MLLLIIFAFLAGLATILAPCIWPVLPIVLSSSLVEKKGHQRPLGVSLGVIASFSFFTLAISYLVKLSHLDPNFLRLLAVIIIAFLGISMVIPPLGARVEGFISQLANKFGSSNKEGNGFLAGFVTGLSLGIVWTPCAGPILATVATLAAIGQVSLLVVVVTLSYVIGVGIPLFIIGYGGQRIISSTRLVNRFTGKIQQVFGVIMILSAVAIFTNYAQYLQIQLLNRFPFLGTVVNGFESSNLVTSQLNRLKGNNSFFTSEDSSGLFNANTPAPDFIGITQWLNTQKPLSMHDLRGKVVLVDFWTYTCINCIRTLPFVTSWYDKYKNDGFVVVGIHTPEFQFEKETSNVEKAIQQYNIHYPVAQDNNYETWQNYTNEYWPAEYLIDAYGNIRRTHFGEGEYDQMEMAIRMLLQEAGKRVGGSLDTLKDQTPQNQISPETYLGSSRMQYYFPNGNIPNGTQSFSLSDTLPENSFSYGGNWTIYNEYAQTGLNAALNYHFAASKVFIILRPGDSQKPTVKVYLDGKIIPPSLAGADVQEGTVIVDRDRLYNLVDLHGKIETHVLRLEFSTPGIQAFTFTFG